uniref:Uncharacterized protein n=1 Tax=Fagus sylvatica TaxID=28930 RepID=A0A2N9IH88_FAGSY
MLLVALLSRSSRDSAFSSVFVKKMTVVWLEALSVPIPE